MQHYPEKIKIAVSGTAKADFLDQATLDLAAKIGEEVARQGAILISGATTGIPLWAAKGAKQAGGMSIGLSPANDEKQHISYYELPLDFMDVVIYTGAGFPGRDILMVRAADAIVIGPGRVGTIHEFTVAFEEGKPIGILEGPWATDDIIKLIIEKSHRAEDNKKIIYDSDPSKLVKRLIEMAKKDKATLHPLKY